MSSAYARSTRVTGWRRVASALWSAPSDPQIFGALDVDATAIRAFIADARSAGHRVTPTHLVGRAVARAFATVPELNAQIRRGRIIPRDSIDIFFITAVESGHDLSGVKVADVERLAAVDVARELKERSQRLKVGDDPEFARTKRLMDALPPHVLRMALRAGAFVTQTLRTDIPQLGLHQSPFGSAMVSSVGMLGLPQGFAPLAWMYDVPLLVLAGELTMKPVVVDGRIEAREVLPVTATIDHRYADGWHISRLMRAFREYLAAPQQFEPAF
jgi:pyruvate/2-oxoglutarate dehydrogenase complex dihydrolipoamide acyltransferase (E2) component